MEIVGTDLEEKQRRSKKQMMMISIALVILLMVSIALGVTIYYLKQKQFKVKINNQPITSFSGDTFVFQDGKIYISLKDISTLIGYKFYNGGYKQYTEDTNKCYLECENEVATFERGSDKIYKTLTDELDYTYYDISEPIISKNDKLYISSVDIGVACNIQIGYTEDNNTVMIYTLPFLVQAYTSRYTTASIADNFNNQKALLYGLLVVQNVPNTEKDLRNFDVRYGIHNLNNEEIVGMKYTNIEFIEGTEEFLVTTEEQKVGVITSDGDTRVSPQYDALKQIDKDRNLYLATNNNRSGVIERNGKILVYLEYDQVGVDTTKFPINDIKNKYILFDNAIPVKQNNKWGLYDVQGNLILPLQYDAIGCTTGSGSNTERTSNNVLTIPDIQGIVFGQNFEIEVPNRSRPEIVMFYGIFGSRGQMLVPVRLSTVYSTTVSGQEQYTMIHEETAYDVVEYVRRWILSDANATVPVEEEVDENTNNSSGVINNSEAPGNTVTTQTQETTVEQQTQETMTQSEPTGTVEGQMIDPSTLT